MREMPSHRHEGLFERVEVFLLQRSEVITAIDNRLSYEHMFVSCENMKLKKH